MHYALEYAKEHKLGKGTRLVVILVDGLRNYMTKHLSKDWMIENKFLPLSEYNDENCKFKGKKLNDLNL